MQFFIGNFIESEGFSNVSKARFNGSFKGLSDASTVTVTQHRQNMGMEEPLFDI